MPVWAGDCSYIDRDVFDYVYFVYCCLKVNEKLLMSKQTGTGQPHIYPEQIITIPIHNYSDTKANQFNKIVSHLFEELEKIKIKLDFDQLTALLLSKMTKTESFKLHKYLVTEAQLEQAFITLGKRLFLMCWWRYYSFRRGSFNQRRFKILFT